MQNHKTKMENQVLSKINSEIYSNIVNIYLGDNYDFETNITKRGNLKIINIFVLYSIFGFFSLSISTFIIVLNRKYNEYSKT